MQVTARSKNPIPMTCSVFRVTESQTRTCGGNCCKTDTKNNISSNDGENPPGLEKMSMHLKKKKKNHNWRNKNYQNLSRVTHVSTDTLQMFCWLLCLGPSVQHVRCCWSQFVNWSSWPLRYSAWTENCWWLCDVGFTGRPRQCLNYTNGSKSGKCERQKCKNKIRNF